jgi:peroxiredoxin-like protein
MQTYPHHYTVQAVADTTGSVAVWSAGLPTLSTAPPAQFGGPGGQWSPETLLVAAAADCFLLTLRAIANASNLAWHRVDCHADGTLDRSDGVVRFTAIDLRVRLVVAAGGDLERARRLVEKAERSCLVTRSLVARPTVHAEIVEGLGT